MANTFSAAVDSFTLKSKRRLNATFRTALEKTTDRMLEPKADGGNLPIDTGFMRASFRASLEGMPSGPSDPEKDAYPAPQDIALVIARTNAGQTFFSGFTAFYTKYQEPKNGFVESAAQKWRIYVAEASAEAKAKIP